VGKKKRITWNEKLMYGRKRGRRVSNSVLRGEKKKGPSPRGGGKRIIQFVTTGEGDIILKGGEKGGEVPF